MILFPSFGGFFAYTSFKLNQSDIAKTICVQRKMVFNTCNGRCELQKSIKKYSENEKEMQNSLKEKSGLDYIQNSANFDLNLIILVILNDQSFSKIESSPIAVTSDTFRPPSFLI